MTITYKPKTNDFFCLQNTGPLVPFIQWLSELEPDDQVWLACTLSGICTTSLQWQVSTVLSYCLYTQWHVHHLQWQAFSVLPYFLYSQWNLHHQATNGRVLLLPYCLYTQWHVLHITILLVHLPILSIQNCVWYKSLILGSTHIIYVIYLYCP